MAFMVAGHGFHAAVTLDLSLSLPSALVTVKTLPVSGVLQQRGCRTRREASGAAIKDAGGLCGCLLNEDGVGIKVKPICHLVLKITCLESRKLEDTPAKTHLDCKESKDVDVLLVLKCEQCWSIRRLAGRRISDQEYTSRTSLEPNFALRASLIVSYNQYYCYIIAFSTSWATLIVYLKPVLKIAIAHSYAKYNTRGVNDETDLQDFVYQPMKNPRQGGFRATIFIFAMMTLDNIGFVANMVSLVLYFLSVMHFDLSGSATTTTNYLGTAFMLTLVGGLISDTYINRLNTCLLFGAIELLGYMLLIVQSHYRKLQPEPCGGSSCVHGTKALLLYCSICLVGLGGGGIRGSVPALGADQFDAKDPKERKYIASFFNWFLLSITVGATVGVTVVVYVSTEVGWDRGFIVSMVCAFVGLLFIALGKPFYRVRVPGESPLLRVLEVLVVTVRNRSVHLPQNLGELYEIRDRKSASNGELIPHSNQFRLFDKAAVLPKGMKPGKWRVCTVTQVEEVKILTRMMPILLSTILMNTCLAQLQTFSVQQGTLMNTKIGKLKVPPASIPVIPLVFMSVLIPVYEFAFVPILRKFTGHPNGITHLQRVGVGLVLSAISMGIAGIIEVKRRHELVRHNNRISLFWLSYHYAIFGIADMFTLVGLMEFFYSEAPAGMRSLSTSFSWLSLSIGYFLSTAFVELINLVTGKFTKSKKGWLEGRDMNKNHMELFYWFLAILSVLNFANYLFWAKWYKYKKDVPSEEENLLKVNPASMDVSLSQGGISIMSRPQDVSLSEEKEEERKKEAN
ncbi:hypothetical protein L1049_017471 [Liquidambar formosana]|uniref:Uncharacterized protein n=1 Tax=Liquidambar formosana TaxID=63359 RepID=A0AAP0X884_LIQFO